MISRRTLFATTPAILAATAAHAAGLTQEHFTTGGMGLVVKRATGSLLVVDRINLYALRRIEGLGDLSHASITFSPAEHFAFAFGRAGGLTKIDLTTASIA